MAFQFPDPNVTPEFKGANGITYSWDVTDGKWVVKGFAVESVIGDCATSEDTVCDQLEQLKLGLVEVEEELESIAPALERGVWLYEQQTGNNAVLRPPNSARYFLLKGYTVGDPLLMGVDFTEDYGDADAVVFSNTEWNLEEEDGTGGSTHNWGTVEVGEIIDLFDKPDNDGLFGKITEINDQIYGNDSILIAFDRIETLGSPTNSEPYLTRLKIFKEPTGGDAGEFVKKRGDDMTGRLRMMRTEEEVDYRPPSDLGIAAIRLHNTQPTTDTTSSACIFQPGHLSRLATSHSLVVKDSVYITDSLRGTWFTDASNGARKATNKKATVYFHGSETESALDDQYGSLRFNNADRLHWTNAGGSLKVGNNDFLKWDSTHTYIPRVGTDARTGFQVKGTQLTNYTYSTGSNGDLIRCYHNSGNSADAAFYYGKITDPNHIATKKYVDDKTGVAISCSSSGRAVGDMWYCSNDQTLYLKVSN